MQGSSPPATGWPSTPSGFRPQSGGAFRDADRLARLRQRVRALAAADRAGTAADADDDAGADRALLEAAPRPSRATSIVVEPHVLVDNGASRSHTVIEVSARDRPGLLHDITRTLSACGLSIGSAHISTVGSRAVDVFYVRDRFGLKLSRDAQIALVQGRLTGMLGRGAGAGAGAAPRLRAAG